MPLPRRQPVGRSLDAGGDRRVRRVAVLERNHFARRHVGEAAAAGAAALQVIGVEQHAGIRTVGAVEDFAQRRDRIDHGMLRVELDREREPVFAADVGAALQVLDRLLRRADILAGRAHHLRAIERDRVLAGLLQHVEQPRALVALGEQPAVFAAERADRNLRRTNDVEHLAVRHAALVAAGEVDAAQLDRIEAAVARGLDRGLERRGVDGPGVQRQASELRHLSYSDYFCSFVEPGVVRGLDGKGKVSPASR